jgi:hypothetical protein
LEWEAIVRGSVGNYQLDDTRAGADMTKVADEHVNFQYLSKKR